LGWVESQQQVARRILSYISAGSAQSERDFSSVGNSRNTLTVTRPRLAPTKVEATQLIRWGCRPASVVNFDC